MKKRMEMPWALVGVWGSGFQGCRVSGLQGLGFRHLRGGLSAFLGVGIWSCHFSV